MNYIRMRLSDAKTVEVMQLIEIVSNELKSIRLTDVGMKKNIGGIHEQRIVIGRNITTDWTFLFYMYKKYEWGIFGFMSEEWVVTLESAIHSQAVQVWKTYCFLFCFMEAGSSSEGKGEGPTSWKRRVVITVRYRVLTGGGYDREMSFRKREKGSDRNSSYYRN